MTISEYKLSRGFKAPRINLKPGERMSYKTLAAGQSVNGYIFSNEEDPDIALPPDVQVIITEDNFAIPLNIIDKVRDVSIDGKPAPQNEASAVKSAGPKTEGAVTTEPVNKKEMPAKIKAELDAIKNKNIVGNIVKQSRNSVTGLMVGAGAGILFGVLFKKPVFLSMTVGATIGGIAGYKLTPPKAKEKKDTDTNKTEK